MQTETETGSATRTTITPDLLTDGTYASADQCRLERNRSSALLGAECKFHRPAIDPAAGVEQTNQRIDAWQRTHRAGYTLPATLIA